MLTHVVDEQLAVHVTRLEHEVLARQVFIGEQHEALRHNPHASSVEDAEQPVDPP